MSAATYARLVEAGAPDLPAGRFYRIRERRWDDSDGLIVELREHKPRGGSRRLQWDYAVGPGDTLERVVRAARRIVRWVAEADEARALIGDHP